MSLRTLKKVTIYCRLFKTNFPIDKTYTYAHQARRRDGPHCKHHPP